MASKPKPKTPKITREGNKFIATWSPDKNYTDQQIKWYFNVDGKWVDHAAKDLSKGTSTNGENVDKTTYFPGRTNAPKTRHLRGIGARLRAKNSAGWSSWSDATMGKFDILKPEKPSWAKCVKTSQENTYTWTWQPGSNNTSSKSAEWRTYYQWETVLVPKGEKLAWSNAKTQTITRITSSDEEETVIGAKSYGNFANATYITIIENTSSVDNCATRYFRVRSAGPQGHSDWEPASYDLGNDKTIDVNSENVSYEGSTSTGTKFTIDVAAYKVVTGDQIRVDYAITYPYVSVTTDSTSFKSDLSLPNGFSDWNVARGPITPNGTDDKINVDLPYYVGDDQRLFIRVVTIHDGVEKAGAPFLLEDGAGTLTKPTLSSFSTNDNTQEITVTVQNNSALNNSFIAVFCQTNADLNPSKPIGIIPYSSSEVTRTFQGAWTPGDTVSVTIRCYVADYTPLTPSASGVTYYTITNERMLSNTDWDKTTTATLPQQPGNVRVSKVTIGDDMMAALVEWDWSWADANMAEISWSTNKYAWDSTEEPSTFTLADTRVGKRYVTGLSAATYWFRVRLIKSEGNTVVYGAYSDSVSKTFSAAPNKPTLTFSVETIPPVVALNEEVTVYWGYETNDGTNQSEARLAEATLVNNTWSYTELPTGVINTAQQYTFRPSDFGWGDGTSHYLCIKLRSGSGEWCDWSNPTETSYVQVAEVPEIEITGIGTQLNDPYPLRPAHIVIDEEDPSQDLDIPLALMEMPLTFDVSGMGTGGYTTVIIERANTEEQERPNDEMAQVFAGETIFSGVYSLPNASETNINVSIGLDDLIEGTHFDNMSTYTMYVSITDHYGQTVSHDPYNFVVYWDSFAEIPTASVVLDKEEGLVYITPSAPSVNTGDYCQVYRLSADKPQLILDKGTFGTTYVDRYPTYGRFGGYRIVYITKYGDYRTEENINAWTDYSYAAGNMSIYDKFFVTINFGEDVLEFKGNISMSNSWAKDFQSTKYLGGSIEGDWNPGVDRTGSINGVIPVEYESEALYLLRKLADYSGICHVRTPEGSNFYADVQVRDDREEKWVNRLSKISLSYTKVRGIENEMPTYTEWIEP